MSDRPVCVVPAKGGWRISVWVQPGAKKTEFAGMHGEHVKIRLQAPAVDNKANTALTFFVAEALGLRPRQVTIESGHGARRKSLVVHAEEEPDWNLFSAGDTANLN